MKLKFDDFWGKRVCVTWGAHYKQGILSKEKSRLDLVDECYIALVDINLYSEYRISCDALDSIGLLDENQ